MKSNFARFASVLAFALVSVAASAQQFGGYNVGTVEARRVIPLEEAVVIDVLPLQLDRAASSEARTAGGVIGGLLGAAAGSAGGNGNWQRSAALGTLGALLGDVVARHASENKIEAVQIVVRTSAGRVMAVGQEANPESFRPGDSVYVMFGQTTRVVRAQNRVAVGQQPQQYPAQSSTPSSYQMPLQSSDSTGRYQHVSMIP